MARHEAHELIAWATGEAVRLRAIRVEGEDSYYAPWGRHEVSEALEFLRLHAPRSAFLESARLPFDNTSFTIRMAYAAVAAALDGWARSVDNGIVSSIPFAPAARRQAATDLMEQAQRLLEEAKVHPAAPIVLAGAALEEFLRSLVLLNGLTPSGKPGINTYSTALQKEDVLTSQDVKDITAWAGLRSAAAHGEFEKVPIERAQIMLDGINLFLRQKTT